MPGVGGGRARARDDGVGPVGKVGDEAHGWFLAGLGDGMEHVPEDRRITKGGGVAHQSITLDAHRQRRRKECTGCCSHPQMPHPFKTRVAWTSRIVFSPSFILINLAIIPASRGLKWRSSEQSLWGLQSGLARAQPESGL